LKSAKNCGSVAIENRRKLLSSRFPVDEKKNNVPIAASGVDACRDFGKALLEEQNTSFAIT
jgi:hypothetical protein